MKKLTSLLLSSALVMSMSAISAISASADVTELPANWDPTAYEYIVVGNDGLVGEYCWQPENENFKMTYDDTANLWYINLDGIANKGEDFDSNSTPMYKVVVVDYKEGKPWEFSFNDDGVAYGLNSCSMVDFGDTAKTAETVTIIFDGERTYSQLDNPYVEDFYCLTGSAPLFDPEWSPNHYTMEKITNTEHSITMSVTEDMWGSNIEYKVTQDGTWDVSYNDKGEATGESSNAKLYIAENTVSIKFIFDEETKCVTAYPEYEDPNEEKYYVVGSSPLFNPEWDADCPEYRMEKTVYGFYRLTISTDMDMWGSKISYKVAKDGKMDVTYNENGLAEGEDSSSSFYIYKGTFGVMFIFDPVTKRTSAQCLMGGAIPSDDFAYIAVGSAPLFDPEWDPTIMDHQLTYQVDGTYRTTIALTEEMWGKEILYKVAKVNKDGKWEESYNDKGLAMVENTEAKLYIQEEATLVEFILDTNTLCATTKLYFGSDLPPYLRPDPTEPTVPTVPTVPTDPTDPTDPTVPTNPTDPTKPSELSTEKLTVAPTQNPTKASTTTTTTSSTATGKVATGDSTSVTILVGMLMLASAGIVFARKKISE